MYISSNLSPTPQGGSKKQALSSTSSPLPPPVEESPAKNTSSVKDVIQISADKNSTNLIKKPDNSSAFSILSSIEQYQQDSSSSLATKIQEKRVYEEAIRNYLEQAAAKQSAKELQPGEEKTSSSTGDSEGTSEQVNQSNPNNLRLRSYRQSLARSQQIAPLSSTARAEDKKDTKVLLYNEAITAYIKQDLFFESISKVGLLVKA